MKNNWEKRYLEQRSDMQVTTRVKPRLLNEDKVLKFITEELKKARKAIDKAREEGWQSGHKQTKESYLGEILPELYGLRANIPLRPDTGARNQAKELIDKLEKRKNEKHQ